MVDVTFMMMLNEVGDEAAKFSVGRSWFWEGGEALEEEVFGWLRGAFGGVKERSRVKGVSYEIP